MDVACLIDILKKMGVPQSWYSINDRLSSDTYILNKVYDRWEYFYFDERGKMNGYKTFNCEDEACKYLLMNIKILSCVLAYSYKTRQGIIRNKYVKLV